MTTGLRPEELVQLERGLEAACGKQLQAPGLFGELRHSIGRAEWELLDSGREKEGTGMAAAGAASAQCEEAFCMYEGGLDVREEASTCSECPIPRGM